MQIGREPLWRPAPDFATLRLLARPVWFALRSVRLLSAVSRMGREAKILLGLLGLLAGVFCGVLSMKLLVHRPPAGAGPDVRVATATVEAGRPSAPAWWALSPAAFAAAPALAPEVGAEEAPDLAFEAMAAERGQDLPRHGDGRAIVAGRFNAPADALPIASGARVGDGEPVVEPAEQDPFVERVAHQEPLSPSLGPVAVGSPSASVAAEVGSGQAHEVGSGGGSGQAHAAPAAVMGVYDAQPGDSWWNVAERAYGDGRFYRALFAWNRSIDPGVSLVPGTRLEIPPLERLMAVWPQLLPR